MSTMLQNDIEQHQAQEGTRAPWARNLLYLWEHRRLLRKVGIIALLVSTVYAFTIPKRYTSVTSIMPPEQGNSGTAALAALAGRSAGTSSAGLASLAGSLLGTKSSGDLYIDLMHSGSVEGALASRFHLQKIYGNRYIADTMKRLARQTEITESRKSGVITIAVEDTDPARAQQLAQGYSDELNKLLIRVSTSSARREREFIEQRLTKVSADLDDAEEQLSKFSSKTSTIDIKAQTQAMVEAGARLQGQLISSQAELQSLRLIYGDENVRVRSAGERIAVIKGELEKMGGSAAAADPANATADELYPPLRQLPELGVQWADLYRRVRVQEEVYELLSAQYESAHIQEAKEVGSVSVIDMPSWPERKSFPSRRWFMIGGTMIALIFASFILLLRRSWREMDENHDLKRVVRPMLARMRRKKVSA